MIQPIIPMMKGDKGAQVANLQDALQMLLKGDVIPENGDGSHDALIAALKAERDEQIYGTATSKTIALFREAQHLEHGDDVDVATANKINELLPKPALSDAGSRQLKGRIMFDYGLPADNLKLRL